MNEIREMVLKNREFLERMSVVYFSVKSAYLNSLKKQKKPGIYQSFIKKYNKEIVIFLASNQPFYGNLILNIWLKVKDYLKYHKDAELVVVGKLGKFLVDSQTERFNYYYFHLSDEDYKNRMEVRKIADFVKYYQTITVFYGKFINSFTQESAMADISGNLIISEGSLLENLALDKRDVLFEPSPEEVLKFFETEIVVSLLNQIVWEHQLAKFASRMISMYQANENAKKEKQRLLFELRDLQKQIFNKKQLVVNSSFQTWIQKIKKEKELGE